MGTEVPLAPRLLSDRYRIGSLLGRGGMAEVYDGYDERLLRAVAVKVLRPDMSADPEVRGRFEVEARSAAGLAHPNVVAVYDTGEDDGTPFIVMERLPGETLADRMAAGPVDQEWLRQVAGDVLGALGAAHAGGIVHRDVKPGNILIGSDGRAKVADFGIAKSLEVGGDATGAGLVVGTPAYVSPERLEGRPATERSDLYSLGVVLYEALAGLKPFDGPTPVAMAQAVLGADPRPLADLRPDVDPGLAAAVGRAMARDPAARPSSAGELLHLIERRPPAAGADPTVAIPLAGEGGDATLVGASGLLVQPAPTPTPGRAGPGRDLPRGLVARAGGNRLALLAAGAVAAVVLLLLLTGGGSGGDTRLVADIRELAGRMEEGDGPQGAVAAERLATIAEHVTAGGGADEANALLVDAAVWSAEGRLSAGSTEAIGALLGRIDGVDPALAVPPTTAPTTVPTTAAPVVAPAPDDEEDESRGKKRGKGRDD